jgi:hypothetical protein
MAELRVHHDEEGLWKEGEVPEGARVGVELGSNPQEVLANVETGPPFRPAQLAPDFPWKS